MKSSEAPTTTLSIEESAVEIEKLRTTIRALEGRVAVTEELEHEVESLRAQLNSAHESNAILYENFQKTANQLKKENSILQTSVEEALKDAAKLRTEIKSSANYINQLEARVYQANKTSLDLLKSVRDLELENATLKNYIVDLKARVAIYVPIKDDLVDKAMAEFINNYPDRNKLKIMFMRETQGVYSFGSKRVNVRMEKGRIYIRVGGGYLSIDEFLDQHTAVELEKLERKDPLKRFSEKVSVHKTIQGRSVSNTDSHRFLSPKAKISREDLD